MLRLRQKLLREASSAAKIAKKIPIYTSSLVQNFTEECNETRQNFEATSMKIVIICLILIGGMVGWTQIPSLPQARTEEESQLLRRVMALLHDHEYPFAYTQMDAYLKENPSTPLADHFYALLGEMAQQDGNFEEALSHYRKVESPELKKYIEFKKWEALHQLSLSDSPPKEVYEELAADIEKDLEAIALGTPERNEKATWLATSYLKLGKVLEALQLLSELANPDPLLLTECYLTVGAPPELVASWAEKALIKYPEEHALHLYLFNAYLEMAGDASDPALNCKAAQHLASIVKIYPLLPENQQWLLSYLKGHDPEQAIPLLEEIVKDESDLRRFDEHAGMLAELYQEYGYLDQAVPLLEKIINMHQNSAPEARLNLAHIYVMQGKIDQAHALYEKLEESTHLAVAFTACLELARLDFSRDPETSLKRLHDLAQRKSLAYEPVHLEAALDYADLMASTYPPKQRSERLLHLLHQMKRDFTHQDNVWAKDYHASRSSNPEKELVYQAYMRYLDARIYALEAQGTRDRYEAKTKLHAAQALLSTLRHGPYAVTPYLREKALAGIDGQ